jgi:hypothetical protein
MAKWRKYIQARKAICLVLIIALVLQFLVQLQAHVHHDDHADALAVDDHVIDYHLITDQHSDETSSSEEVHELKTTPDFILKKTLDRDFSSLFLGLFLILVIITQVGSKPIWFLSKDKLIHNFYYGLAPPSRSPPVI